MKTIAIIGAKGALGSDLVRYLDHVYHITPIDRENSSAFIGHSFDVVINANGNSKRYWADNHPVEDFVASTLSVYKSIFDFPCGLYIYVSSSDVYPDHTNPLTTREDRAIDQARLSSYGFHKYISEGIVKKYAQSYIIFRSSMILAKNLKKGPIYDILHHVPLFITEDSRLQLLITRELADVICCILDKKISNETFNLGGSGTISFKKINTYFPMAVSFSPRGEKQEYEMNVTKLKKLYPLRTSTEYIREFIGSL